MEEGLSGSFGTVFQREKDVLKQYHNRQETFHYYFPLTFLSELSNLNLLKKWKQENKSLAVVEIYSHSLHTFSLTLEKMDTDLFEWVNHSNLETKLEAFPFFYSQIGNALRFLHSKGFYHFDIKTENILLQKVSEKEYLFKLCDFGLSGSKTLIESMRNGIPSFHAPESSLYYYSHLAELDIWSFGVSSVNFFTNDSIVIEKFNYLKKEETKQKFLNRYTDSKSVKINFIFPHHNLPYDLILKIEKLLLLNPEERGNVFSKSFHSHNENNENNEKIFKKEIWDEIKEIQHSSLSFKKILYNYCCILKEKNPEKEFPTDSSELFQLLNQFICRKVRIPQHFPKIYEDLLNECNFILHDPRFILP